MIYLIGGPPKCGKSTLAKYFSKESNISWLSLDTLQTIVERYTEKSELPKKFPYQEVKKVTKGSIDLLYALYSLEEIMSFYRTAAKSTWEAVRLMIKSLIDDRDDFILEGLHIEPKLIDELLDEYGKEKISSVFLIKTEEEQFVTDIMKSTTSNDWILKGARKKETHQRIAKMICEYGIYFQKEAQKYNLPYFVMDKDFEEKMREIVSFLLIR